MKRPAESTFAHAIRGVAFAAPLIVLLAAFLIWPLFIMAGRSLGGAESVFSLQVYREVLTDPLLLRAFGYTALLSTLATVVSLAICTPAAIYIEGPQSVWRRVAAVALAAPLSLPGIVIGFFVILGFGRTGVFTDFLRTITDLRNPQFAYTFWGMLLGYVYFAIPRVLLVIRGAVSSIGSDAVHAARTLGAGPWRVFFEVVLPTLRPALISAASLSLATSFGAFGTAATLSRDIRVVPLEIAALFTERFQPDKAAALSILLATVTITLIALVGRIDRTARA
jgi:putative spermidine/putrescine transport system permease protein